MVIAGGLFQVRKALKMDSHYGLVFGKIHREPHSVEFRGG